MTRWWCYEFFNVFITPLREERATCPDWMKSSTVISSTSLTCSNIDSMCINPLTAKCIVTNKEVCNTTYSNVSSIASPTVKCSSLLSVSTQDPRWRHVSWEGSINARKNDLDKIFCSSDVDRNFRMSDVSWKLDFSDNCQVRMPTYTLTSESWSMFSHPGFVEHQQEATFKQSAKNYFL